ncbi:MAG: hypothetical protein JWQ74_2226 [Marmoricola sp.]|nr:hypothetical protein [Marmoricola sp.]
MQFTEAELTAALTATAKAAFAAQDKEIRKGRVDLEQAWADLGGYGRYQLLEGLGAQLLPILLALPDRARVVGERPTYSKAELATAVEEFTDDPGGRIRRKAIVLTRIALVQTALANIPPWADPDVFVVPDSL